MEDASQRKRIGIVVLAAGKGTRMKGELPKALMPLGGKPMVQYVLDAIQSAGVCAKPVIVVGHRAEQVAQALGQGYLYVHQSEQLGTAHAVAMARRLLEGNVDRVMVLYGDHPCLRAETIRALSQGLEGDCVIQLLTTTVEDFNDWRAPLAEFGRVIRDAQDMIQQVIEITDLNEGQKDIREVSLTMSCYRSEWLWPHLEQLNRANAQQEYYLADLIGLAVKERECVYPFSIDSRESIGVNRPEHLAIAERFLKERGS